MASRKTIHEGYANIAIPGKKSKALLSTCYKGFASNVCVNVIELYEKDTDNARI